jgi:hypothetical protein
MSTWRGTYLSTGTTLQLHRHSLHRQIFHFQPQSVRRNIFFHVTPDISCGSIPEVPEVAYGTKIGTEPVTVEFRL